MSRAVAALAASLALLPLPAAAAAQRPRDSTSLPPLNVPYVSQGEQLCGGAAAAMLMRAAGARGVYAEDFQSLVDASAGGIHTQALADALRARGYSVRVFHGPSLLLQELIAGGTPVLALIEDRPGRFHYVVVVGWTRGKVVFHDPARAPFLTRPQAEFERAWRVAGEWMLVLDRHTAPDAAPADRAPATAPIPSPDRDRATARFLDRDYVSAAALAARAAARNPTDLDSWRLLGASRYLAGDAAGALDAWNRANDPIVDLVRIEGLSRTPHRTVEKLIGLAPGSVLTREGLIRADRRLALLPAQDASRVSYVALPRHLAEVRGAIVERPLFPSRIEWLAAAARVPINRELSFSMANLASAGDRLSAAWRFWEGRRRVGVDFSFPSRTLGGAWQLSSDWQQEQYAEADASERRGASVAWTNWMTARIRLFAASGVASWTDRGRGGVLTAGAELRPLSDRMALELSSSGASGSMPGFATGSAMLRWRQPAGAFRLLGGAAVVRASARAPMDEWPGAGAGVARPLLLRAHPLLGGGRIEGPVFGRTVAQGTVEIQRDVARRGIAALAVAGFADTARAWDRVDRTASPFHVDLGVGLRLRLAPGLPSIRLDLARGLRDGRTAVTAGWQGEW